jgi:hypothetical protein
MPTHKSKKPEATVAMYTYNGRKMLVAKQMYSRTTGAFPIVKIPYS